MNYALKHEVVAWLRWHADRLRKPRAMIRWAWGFAVLLTISGLTLGMQARDERSKIAAQMAARVDHLKSVTPATVTSLPDVGGKLPAARHSAEQLQRLYELAEQTGVQLLEGDYRLRSTGNPDIVQLTLSLPLKTDYQHLQRFLAVALYELPNLALDSMQVQRDTAEKSELDVKLQMLLYLHNDQERK